MVAAVKLLHLLEAFSTPWFLFSAPSNHHLVFFLLEIFNNIIQYQFDGNANLVYTIIRKRHVFHALANLPSDVHGISKCLSNRKGPAPAVAPTVTAAVTNSQHVVNRGSPTLERRQNKLVSSNALNGGHESIKSPTTPTTPLAAKVTTSPNPTGGGGGGDEDEPSDVETKSDLGEASMEGSRPALPAEPGTLKASLLDTPAIGLMTERESAHPLQTSLCDFSPLNEHCDTSAVQDSQDHDATTALQQLSIAKSDVESTASLTRSVAQRGSIRVSATANSHSNGGGATTPTISSVWHPTPEWVASWRAKLPLQTIMRLLQVLVPQVEKICIDK